MHARYCGQGHDQDPDGEWQAQVHDKYLMKGETIFKSLELSNMVHGT